MRNFLFCTYPSSFLIEFFALLTFASCACCDWWWREIVLVFRLRFHHPLHFFVCLLSYLTMLSTTRDLALATLLLFNSFFFFLDDICVCVVVVFSVFSRLLNLSKHFLFLGFTTLLFSFSFAGLFALQYNNCTFFCLFVLYSFLIKNQFLCFYSLFPV